MGHGFSKFARKDTIQADVVKVFQCMKGFEVHETHAAGGGFPDLVVMDPRRAVHLLEVKSGDKAKLTPAQERFHAVWDVTTITSPIEAAAWAEGLE